MIIKNLKKKKLESFKIKQSLDRQNLLGVKKDCFSKSHLVYDQLASLIDGLTLNKRLARLLEHYYLKTRAEFMGS